MEQKDISRKKERNFSSLVSALGNLYNKVNNTRDEQITEDQQFVLNIKEAFEEWQSAEKFFHNVTDPDLIDHAIYKLEATKARYTYLLKQAKANGIKMDFH